MYVPIKSGIDGPRLFPQLSILGTPPGGLFRSAAHELDEASFESVPGLGGIDRGIRGGVLEMGDLQVTTGFNTKAVFQDDLGVAPF